MTTTRLSQARQKVHTIAAKMTAIVDNASLSDADKLKQLDAYQPDLDAAQAEVKSLEAIARRRTEVFRNAAPGDSRPGQWSGAPSTPNGVAPPLTIPEAALKELHSAAIQRRSLRLDLDTPSLGTKGPNNPEDWSGSYVPPKLMPPLLGISEPNRVAVLFPAGSMTGPSVEYVRITGHDGAAGVVAPGALKPDIGLLSEKLDAKAVKVAGVCNVEDESLEDFPNFAQVVTAELQRAVTDSENYELLSGNGNDDPVAGPLHMLGLLNTPGVLTRTAEVGDTMADTMEQAIADLRVGPSFAEADAVVLHPRDWSAIRRIKDSTGRYVVDQDPTKAGSLSLWGVRVTVTTMMPVGTAVVGRFALGGVLHIRRGLTVEASNQTNDNWQRNRTTLRAELREVLAVERPTAFVKVDLTP